MSECKIPVFRAFFVSMRRLLFTPGDGPLRGPAFVVPVIALFAACGGGGAATGGADMKGPGSFRQEEPEPKTIDEAKQQLDQAVAAMDRRETLVAQPATNDFNGGGGGGAVAPRPQPPPTAVETDCQRMCRAFASMQRAQTALCRMAGEDDPRCTEAKKVVEDNAKRVAQCGCQK